MSEQLILPMQTPVLNVGGQGGGDAEALEGAPIAVGDAMAH